MTEQPLSTVQPAPVLAYATPLAANATSDVWRDGTRIVARNNATFPGRCVKCNGQVDRPPMKRVYYWHPGAIYLIILFNLIIYAIVAIVVRKKGIVHIGLCNRHRSKRTVGLLVGWIAGLGGACLMIAGSVNASLGAFLAGLAMFATAIVFGVCARLLRPKKIDDHFLWLAGACPEFVATLDPIPT